MPMAPELKETIVTMIQNSRQLVSQISQRPGAGQQGQQPPPSQGVPPPAPGGAPAPPPGVNQPPAPTGGPPGGLPPPPGVLRPAGFGGNPAGTGGNAVPVRPTPRNPSGGANPAAPPNLPGPAGAPMPPPMPPVTAGGGGSSLFPPSGSGGGSDMAGLASQFASFGVGGGSQPSNTGGGPLPPTRYGQTCLVFTYFSFQMPSLYLGPSAVGVLVSQ